LWEAVCERDERTSSFEEVELGIEDGGFANGVGEDVLVWGFGFGEFGDDEEDIANAIKEAEDDFVGELVAVFFDEFVE